MELLEIWQVQSGNVLAAPNLNNLVFLYVILCCIIKRSVFLLAFLLPELLFNLRWFDFLSGWHINAIEVIIYSYVINSCVTNKSKLCCGLVIITAFVFCYDSYFYGESGYYGTVETVIYKNIASINLCSHILFISSLIPVGRIRNYLRNAADVIASLSRNSAYLCIC